jgi:hypothetical protein
MTPEEFKTVVVPTLEAIFESHGKTLADRVASLWWVTFSRYDANVVVQALTKYVSRAEVTYNVVQPNDIMLLIKGSPEDRAAAAWHKFFAAVRDRSPYLSIIFDDPYIHATVKYMGGWAKVAQEMEVDAREMYRRVFEDNYKQFLRSGLPADTPLRLPGVVENQCIADGRRYDHQTQFVGDRAVAVLLDKGSHPAVRTPTSGAIANVSMIE